MNKQIHITARAIIIADGYILLAYAPQEKERAYFLPGGHVEHHEKIEDALKREMIEELGVECTIKRLVGILESTFKPHEFICHTHSVSFYFEASSPLITPKNVAALPQNGDDSFLWHPLEKLQELRLNPINLASFITQWLTNPALTITSSINHSADRKSVV